ncbi:Do family serine endopeptidase [Robiginitomaculum antarcticum]|uniref:Do family serine endopeptidase n=1 Tax=Robiginitomaculum antarcticum TaxID=437507 RepID=UPI0003811722|nr:Do family serine endopeptidase [Robiginitomaculum antarcticum]
MTVMRAALLGSALLTSSFAAQYVFAPLASAQVSRPVDFVDLAERLSPAVVNISTSQNIEPNVEMPDFPNGSPLERFNDFFGNGEGRIASSLGSGFVVNKNGTILTNNHVIVDADVIEVTFPDGETYTAKLIGRDPKTDVAVLKIEAGRDLPFVEIANSDDVKVGEWVMAIGNPFGYAGTVTVGIVSARNRNLGNNAFDDFIQSDVAINKGNSGGPLFNMDGKVVGMNTAIISPTGGSIGLSFTTPINIVSQVSSQLENYGETRRGYLGANVQPVTADIAASYKLNDAKGALIKKVEKDGPADKAGLQVGDIILSYNGVELEKSSDIFLKVADTKIDSAVKVRYLRKGKRVDTANVTITRLKEDPAEIQDGEVQAAKVVAMGVAAESLTPALRRKYRIPGDVNGVLITHIKSRSAASGKLRVGDVISQIEYKDVKNVEDFKSKVDAASKEGLPIMILVNRGGYPVIYSVRDSS